MSVYQELHEMTNSKKIGNYGEMVAKNYLINRGCHIIATNYHSRFGEIDIIATQKEAISGEKILLFIEVKYRKNEFFSSASSSITPKKQNRMLLTIESYLQAFPIDLPLRIDLITVIGKEPHKIEWLMNIFGY